MSYRGGGGGGRGCRGDQQYDGGERGAPEGGRVSAGWPPPDPYTPAFPVFHNPNATGPQHGVVVRRPKPTPPPPVFPYAPSSSSPTAVPFEPAPTPPPSVFPSAPSSSSPTAVPFQPAPTPPPSVFPSAPSSSSPTAVPFQPAPTPPPSVFPYAPSSSPTAVPFQPAPTPPPSSSPTAVPFQPARVSAPALTPVSVAKQLEQTLFVTETALPPPAVVAAVAVAASQVRQPDAEKAPEVDLAPISKNLVDPARPSAGIIGKKVMLRAKYFLTNIADKGLFHYDVSINPESKSRDVNREVLSELIKLHGQTSLGGKLTAYDGRNIMYTAGLLPFEFEQFAVTIVDPEKEDNERTGREYLITIQIAGRTDLFHLQPQESVGVLDVVLKDRYNYNLQHTSWPCLQSGSDVRPVNFPMEACKIVEGKRSFNKLNDKQMFLHNNYLDDKFAQEFGIKFCNDLIYVPPMLKYYGSEPEKTCPPSVGQWNMIGKSVHPRPLLDIWTYNPNHIENALRDFHTKTAEMLNKQGNDKHIGKIKNVCETDLGIVSQCSRQNKQYMENVAPKINVKVGVSITILATDFVPNGISFVSETPTIIFGADIVHPAPGEDSASSTAAVVASMDWPAITKHRGLVSAQPHGKENIEELFSVINDPLSGTTVSGGMIRALLIAFRMETGRRPERILFYRGGVREGQFSHILRHEMEAIKKACASLEEGYLPPVTFVVVQRGLHGKREMTDKSGNILPGTEVGLMICGPTEFDFCLCSHAGIQGTSRPTHYNVLYDENHFTADAIQALTNNLCYTYTRCTPADSVVPAVEYAYIKASLRSRHNSDGRILQEFPLEERIITKNLLLGGHPRRSDRVRGLRDLSPIPDKERKLITPLELDSLKYVKDIEALTTRRILPDSEIIGVEKEYDLINYDGRILALSISRTFVVAIEAKQSWNGDIWLTDFVIINGRAILRKQPKFKGCPAGYERDSAVCESILRHVFMKTGLEFPYMDELRDLLKNPAKCSALWALDYRCNPMVFRDPLQQTNVVTGIMKMYNGLNNGDDGQNNDKMDFRHLVDKVLCPGWIEAKKNIHFAPIIAYRVNVLKKGDYSDKGWGAFTCLRNFEVHGTTFPWGYSHLVVNQILGDFVADVVKKILKDGRFDIYKALIV